MKQRSAEANTLDYTQLYYYQVFIILNFEYAQLEILIIKIVHWRVCKNKWEDDSEMEEV